MQVLTDYKDLDHFTTTKLFNFRQTRWSWVLSQFNITIEFMPGKVGRKPADLTTRSGDPPEEAKEGFVHNKHVLMKQQHILRMEIGTEAEEELTT